MMKNVVVACCLLALCTAAGAQDRIYLDDAVIDAVVTDITAEEVQFRKANRETGSLPRAQVRLMFRKDGRFLSPRQLDTAAAPERLVHSFTRGTVKKGFSSDRILTAFYTVIHTQVLKHDDVFVYHKTEAGEDQVAKTSITAVIYANGSHLLLAAPAAAAPVLAELSQTTPASFAYVVEEPKMSAAKPQVAEKPARAEEEKETKEKTTVAELPQNVATAEVKKEEPAKILKALLLVMAGKKAPVSVTLNEKDLGTVKAGGTQRLELEAGTYQLKMDDKLGNLVEKTIVIDASQYGQTVSVQFPEIDYNAIRAQQQEELAGRLNTLGTAVQEKLALAATAREALSKDSLQVLAGEKELDGETEKLNQAFVSSRTEVQTALAALTEWAGQNGMKEAARADIQKLSRQLAALSPVLYIQQFRSGKKPSSSSLAVALKKGRVSDLKFFLRRETINDADGEGYTVLQRALLQQADSAAIAAILGMGASANSFSRRLESNGRVYASPLALACSTAHAGNIAVLLRAGATLYPPFAPGRDKKQQVKFAMQFVKGRTDIIQMMEKAGITMTDYEGLQKQAVDAILADMVKVEGGSFTLGCVPDVTTSCLASETPAAQVKLGGFYLGRFEVTRQQWAAVMEEDNVQGLKECPSCPMSPVSYTMAQNFLLQLNEISGKKFRLPTEAEWEFAAAGGAAAKQKFAGAERAADVAWTSENSGAQVHPVGQKKANALGLHDMSGNVAEWCSGWYQETYYRTITPENPQGPAEGTHKVLRGGSYLQSEFSARTTRRWGEFMDFLNPGVGFRLALTEK